MKKKMNPIQERIEKLRKSQGWTRSHLADEIGISKNSVYAWFGEKPNMPSIVNIQAICDATHITITEFFSEIELDKLSAQEVMLIETFKKVPDDQKIHVLDIVKSFTKQ